MSSISCLVAQLTVMLDKACQSFQQVISFNSEPHACGGFLRECFHVENLLYPPDISDSLRAFVCVVLCLLAPCWSPGH